MQLRGILLGILHGTKARLPQVLVTGRLLFRKHQRRLDLIHIRLVGPDLCLLHLELRIDVLDAGLCGRNLRLRLLQGGPIVALIDVGDHIAGGHVLIVGDGDGGDVAGYLRG
jgi:hypothetical protein